MKSHPTETNARDCGLQLHYNSGKSLLKIPRQILYINIYVPFSVA